jgi:hypothetical protein
MCALTDVLKRGFKSIASFCEELDIMKKEMLYSLIGIVLGFLTLVAQVSFLFASGIHYSSRDGYNLRMNVNNLR